MMKDVAASKTALIYNRSKQLGVSHDMLLRKYVYDRFLQRLAFSEYAEALVLKGAMALSIYVNGLRRPTKDIDFVCLSEDITADNAVDVIRELAAQGCGEDDGVRFLLDEFTSETINIKGDEPGVRVLGNARLGNAKVPLKIEISYGHRITPEPNFADLPEVLPSTPKRSIWAYPAETIVAEKFQAIVDLGTRNSRFKDFFDLLVLLRSCDFDGETLAAAVANTFERRGTEIPLELPVGFSPDFIESQGERGWKSFVKKIDSDIGVTMAEAVDEIAPFCMGVCAMARGDEPIRNWQAGQGFEDISTDNIRAP